MSTAFEGFVEDYQAHFLRDANRRVALGVAAPGATLPDPSLAALDAELERARGLLERARGLVSDEGLDDEQRLDLELAALALELSVCRGTLTFNGERELAQRPSAADDISDGVFLIFVNDPRPSSARLDDILGRLEGVDGYLEKLEARLTTPVARWAQMELDKLAGLPELFDTIVAWARQEGYGRADALAAAAEHAAASLAAYGERLRARPTTTRFAIGDAQARRLVRLRGIPLGFEALHGIARDFLARTRDEIEGLRERLVAKYADDLAPDASVEALHAFLNARYRVSLGSDGALASILERYREEDARIEAFIKNHELFPLFDEQEMLIIQTPGFMEPSIPAGAMMPPPALREGTRRSIVYLTLRHDLLDEHNKLEIAGMMIHEGTPGHHLQLAWASRHPSMIRRLSDWPEQAEGWTTMLEDYMLDVGYMGELTDEARFFVKRGLMRLGARVVIDLYFMTGDATYLDVGLEVARDSDDPFVNAAALLGAVTGFTPGRIQAELNWYSQERGYPLSYLTGNHLVWALKRELIAAQEARLSPLEIDRLFHRAYLEAGNMPVSFLRRRFVAQGLIPA